MANREELFLESYAQLLPLFESKCNRAGRRSISAVELSPRLIQP
jgi:hypothetical protein